MRLSKTKMRRLSQVSKTTVRESESTEPPALMLDRKSTVYSTLFHLAWGDFPPVRWKDTAQTPLPCTPILNRFGILPDLLARQRITWIVDEVKLTRQLSLRFSRETLLAAGLLDADGHFRFARHRLLVPFIEERSVEYFVGMDPELTLTDIQFPTPSLPLPYRIPLVESATLPRKLYLTPEIHTALRLGALGKNAWAMPQPSLLTGQWLELLSQRDLCFCLDAQWISDKAMEPYWRILQPRCRGFKWQTLGQIETEWLLVQTRNERAQLRSRLPGISEDESPWIQRVVNVFRQKGDRLFSLLSRPI